MEQTDVEIINRCISGNHEAFSEIITRYKKLVYGVVANMIQDKHEVNDVAQEAFLKMYKSLSQYNSEFKFSTWAVKITSNLCIDMLKKKKTNTVSLESIKEISGSNDCLETSYIKKETYWQVQQALLKLPEKYRTLLILFHQNELSYKELMDKLKEPVSIIKNRLYRARLMLLELLKSERREGML